MNVLGLAILTILLVLFGVFIGGRLIEYSIEYWVGQFKDSPVDIPRGPCYAAGFFFGWNIGIPAGVITWITSMVWERPAEI